MKRFIIDAVFVFILIAIGSTIQNTDTSSIKDNLNEQKESFEENIALHKPIEETDKKVTLNEIDENKASELAKNSSNFIVDVIDTSVSIVSEVFHGIVD